MDHKQNTESESHDATIQSYSENEKVDLPHRVDFALPLPDQFLSQDIVFLEKTDFFQTKNLAESYQQLIYQFHTDQKTIQDIALFFKNLTPMEQLEIIHYLSPPERREMLFFLDETALLSGALLMALDRCILNDFLNYYREIKTLQSILSQLPSDDCFEILQELPADLREDYLDTLKLNKNAYDMYLLMKNAPKNNILRIMQTEAKIYDVSTKVESVLKDLGHMTDTRGIYDIFVSKKNKDKEGFCFSELIGSISFLDLLRCPVPAQTILVDLVKDTVFIPWTFSQEDAAILFHKHDLICAPVVNDKKVMLGVVTVDDILDVIQACAQKDILGLTGVASSNLYIPITQLAWERLKWMGITLLTCLLSSYVLSHFQDVIEKNVTLAIIYPITGVLGGANGSQVTTVTIRNLNNKLLNRNNFLSIFWRELRITLINGLCLGLALFVLIVFSYHDDQLGLFFVAATIFNMLWATFIGFFLPIALEYYHFDPAVCANLIVTASADIVGMSIFLFVAGLLNQKKQSFLSDFCIFLQSFF